MAFQSVFKRYELKYVLTARQKELALKAMEPYMALDQYGRTVIRNVYYDTENYRLVRRSLEHPVYKEKLRLRSYGSPAPGENVFVELKKKYRSVVYKRRLVMPEEQAMAWIAGESDLAPDTQIGREIEYFRRFYGTLRPVVFLTYEREAFYSREGDSFRVTFDENIRARTSGVTLGAPLGGTRLIEEGLALMELKTMGGIPLWMTRFMTEERIVKASFSKYGTAYQKIIFPGQEGGFGNA